MSRTKPVRLALIGLMMIAAATFGGLLGAFSTNAESSKSADRNGILLAFDQSPIENGLISVFNDTGDILTDVTSGSGSYSFKALPYGHYIFLYEAQGYLSEKLNVLVNPWDKRTLTPHVTLDPIETGNGGLNLTVEDGNGAPLAGMAVTIEHLDQTQATYFGADLGHPSWTNTTNASGFVSFSNLANGEYRATATDNNYYFNSQTFSVVGGNTTADYFNLSARNENISVRIFVEDEGGLTDSATVTMYQLGVPAQPGESAVQDEFLYEFHPEPGTYLFTAALPGYQIGMRLTTIDSDNTFTINLNSKSATNQTHNLDFSDWDSLTWTTTTDHSYDDGRVIDTLDVGFTGLLLFDIDRIWGDNDGNVTQVEMDAYEAWEQAWDVSLPLTAGQLDVNDAGYSYLPGSFSYSLNYPLGGSPSGEPVDSTASFSTTTAATYTASQEDQDTYTVELWVANSQGSDFPYNYNYHLDWPADNETTGSTSQSAAKATITGTPDSDITTASGTAKGGLVTLTVTRNVLPEPVIDITTGLNKVDIIDGDGELVELWVVQSNTQVNFSAANSDDSVEITAYEWTFTGAQDTTKTGAEANTTFTSSNQNVTVTLTLSDAHGTNDTSLTIYVDDTAPEAEFNITLKPEPDVKGEPYALTNGTSNVNEDEHVVVFDAGNSTDPFLGDNSIVLYDWVFSDNWTNDGPTISRTFDDPGDYTITLTITDAAGNTDSLSKTVLVNDIEPPEPAFTWCGYNESGNCTPEAGEVGWPIQFNASTTVDNSGTIVSYNWSVAKSGENVTTDYLIEPVSEDSMLVNITFLSHKDGGYTVTLTVNDSANNTAQFSRQVVPARPFLPDLYISDITRDIELVTEGDEVTFTVEVGLQGKDVEADFQVSLYIDEADETHLLANRTVKADDINSAEDRFVNFTVTWKAEAGEHKFIALVDSGQAITEGEPGETQETKNTLTDGVFVEKEETDTGSGPLIYGVLAVVAVLAIGGYYLYNRGRFDKD